MIHYEKAVATLGALNRHELIALRSLIDDLLALEEPEDLGSAVISSNQKASLGHIELKSINGYGPYKYLRRWKGKTLTSTYLGKARS